MKKVIVLGGYGSFGERIVENLISKIPAKSEGIGDATLATVF
jgi:hypothetical protein